MALHLSALPRLLFLVLVLFWLSVTLARADTSFPYGLNDLSVLLPLPQSAEEEALMLRPSDAARGGALIPPAVLDRLPTLVMGGDPSQALNGLRVAAVRFDPCFREGEEACRRQIRIVLQPIGIFRRAYSYTDAAVHLFFDFSAPEWDAVMKDWVATAVGSKADPLTVHPQLTREGLRGPHWAKLRALVLKHCGPARLSRFTASNVNLFGTQWTFVGHNVSKDGRMTPIQIPGLTTAGQTFVGDLGNLQEFLGTLFPAPPGDKELNRIWNNSVGARNTMRPEEMAKALSRAVAFQNPKQFHPGNVDCVSCHLAQNTQSWGERNYPQWFKAGAWASMFERERFASGWNLSNPTPSNGFTNRVRAFGYFVDEPVITQRVINETAAMAERIEADLKPTLRALRR